MRLTSTELASVRRPRRPTPSPGSRAGRRTRWGRRDRCRRSALSPDVGHHSDRGLPRYDASDRPDGSRRLVGDPDLSHVHLVAVDRQRRGERLRGLRERLTTRPDDDDDALPDHRSFLAPPATRWRWTRSTRPGTSPPAPRSRDHSNCPVNTQSAGTPAPPTTTTSTTSTPPATGQVSLSPSGTTRPARAVARPARRSTTPTRSPTAATRSSFTGASTRRTPRASAATRSLPTRRRRGSSRSSVRATATSPSPERSSTSGPA